MSIETIVRIAAAFANFMSNRKDLENAILSSTKASWEGSSYSLELFEDGTYHVLGDNEIGNLYTSPGIVIPIPPLNRDEYVYTEDDDEDGEDTGAIYYPSFDNAEDDLRMIFQDYLDQERWDNK